MLSGMVNIEKCGRGWDWLRMMNSGRDHYVLDSSPRLNSLQNSLHWLFFIVSGRCERTVQHSQGNAYCRFPKQISNSSRTEKWKPGSAILLCRNSANVYRFRMRHGLAVQILFRRYKSSVSSSSGKSKWPKRALGRSRTSQFRLQSRTAKHVQRGGSRFATRSILSRLGRES